jgi:hypothetical protein
MVKRLPRKELINIKYFPFAEGIPYKVKNKHYILPEIDTRNWSRIFSDRIATLVLNGGFIENLFSLSFFEVMNYLYPNKKMEWCGDNRFSDLVRYQSLAKVTNRISPDKLIGYPVPFFFNKSKTAVFVNILNNYIDVFSFRGDFKYVNKKTLFLQMFNNVAIDWNEYYLPKFRSFDEENDNLIKQQFKIYNLNKNLPTILIIPEKTGLSMHDIKCLDWSFQDVKSFSSMVSRTGYNLVVLSKYPRKYHGVNCVSLPDSIYNIIYFLKKSSVVLSRDVDFLLAELFLGKAVIFSLRTTLQYRIQSNQKYIGSYNDVFSIKEIKPIDVFKEL